MNLASFGVLAFVLSSGTTNAFAPKARPFSSMRTAVSQSTLTETKTAQAPVTSTETIPGEKRKILEEPALWEYNFGIQDPRIALPHSLVQDESPPETYQITQEQIRTLERDGVVHIKGVFDEEWVEYLRKATAHQVDNPHFWAFAGTASRLYDYIQRNVVSNTEKVL
jgi:hypothetical protein